MGKSNMSQVIKCAAVLAFPVILEKENDPRVKNTPRIKILVSTVDIYDESDENEERSLWNQMHPNIGKHSPKVLPVTLPATDSDGQESEINQNDTINCVDDVTGENKTEQNCFIPNASAKDPKLMNFNDIFDRVPFSLIPKSNLGCHLSNQNRNVPSSLVPAVYSQYSSEPSSIVDLYCDDEFDQAHLGLVMDSIKLDDMEGEMAMKDMLDNVFLSMSMASSCPNSLDSYDSVIGRGGEKNVTLASEDYVDVR